MISHLHASSLSGDDRRKLTQLYGACFAGSGEKLWTEQDFEALAKTADCRISLIGDKTFLGFLIVSIAIDTADILAIGVHPSARNQGMAKNLLNNCIASLRAERVKSLFLEVRANNTDAINLYDSFGFKQNRRRSNYYKLDGNIYVDAIEMILSLI